MKISRAMLKANPRRSIGVREQRRHVRGASPRQRARPVYSVDASRAPGTAARILPGALDSDGYELREMRQRVQRRLDLQDRAHTFDAGDEACHFNGTGRLELQVARSLGETGDAPSQIDDTRTRPTPHIDSG